MNHQVARPALATLAYELRETVIKLPPSLTELDRYVHDWLRVDPRELLSYRIPTEYASPVAARLISGPFIWLSSEETYKIATHSLLGVRIEIVGNAPPPPPPLPPVLEMPATLNLEVTPGRHAALDITCNSFNFDMSRLDDGTVIEGSFWGKLDIVHDFVNKEHHMEFGGTRLPDQNYPPEFLFDRRVMTRLKDAAKPSSVAKCQIYISAPDETKCEVTLSFAPLWQIGVTYPAASQMEGNRLKWPIKVTPPNGLIEDISSKVTCSSLYYEATPDPSVLISDSIIAPSNSFALPSTLFIHHITKIFESLGVGVNKHTVFLQQNLTSLLAHHNIAYRLMPPNRVAGAVEITIDQTTCVFLRVFLIWKGLDQADFEVYSRHGSGEYEAKAKDWRPILGYSDAHKDKKLLRILEISVLEVT